MCLRILATVRPDLARLGRAVRERRLALDLTQRQAADAAGISDTTWLSVEKGEKVSDRTLAKVERAMAWLPGSVDSILNGHAPSEPDIVARDADGHFRAVDITGRERTMIEDLKDQVYELGRTVDQLQAEVARLKAARQPQP